MFPRRYWPYALATAVLIIVFYGYSTQTSNQPSGLQEQLQPAAAAPSPAPKKASSAHACAVSPDTPLKIVPCGDSITEGEGSSDYNGYRLFLYQHLMADCAERSVEFVGSRTSGYNLDPSIVGLTQTEGYSGWDVERLLNFSMEAIGNTLEQQKPNVMLLHIGTNNVAPFPLRPPDIVEPADAPEKLVVLIDEILKLAPSIVLIIAQIITSPNFGWKDNTPPFNAAIPEMVARKKAQGYKILSVDMSSVGSDCVRDFDGSDVDCEDINADGLHPKDEGYRKMAGFWYEALVQATEMGYLAQPKTLQ